MPTRFPLVALILLPLSLWAQGKPGLKEKPAAKIVLEKWQAAYFEGVRAGHSSLIVEEITRGKQKVYRSVRKVQFSLKRYGSVVPIKMEQIQEETADGTILSVEITQELGTDKFIKLTGKVEDGKLVLTLPGGATRKLDWDKKALGQYAQETIFKRKKAKSGDRLDFVSFELLLGATYTIKATVKTTEAVDKLTTKKVGKEIKIVRVPAKLLRAEIVPGKIKVGEREIAMPRQTLWLDGDLMPVREQADLEGLGSMTLYTTTKAAATKGGLAPDQLPDIGLRATVTLKQNIEKPYDTTSAVYKITVKDAEKPGTTFAKDERQQPKNIKGNTFELHVTAKRAPGKGAKGAKPGEEYTKSSYFVDSDSKTIKELAKKIVGKETDAWKMSQRLEKWVNENMKYTTASGFPTASQVCKSFTGDCRQHAILLAALCRAAGVPSRTAVGLVYAREPGRSPVFGFHMWTEVWITGQWLGLDAVLGKGGIGATHLKINDHSWAKTETLAPLLPVQRVLGKLSIEVISSK